MLAGRQANFEARIWMWFASAKTSSCGPGTARCISEGCVWKSARSSSDHQAVCVCVCVCGGWLRWLIYFTLFPRDIPSYAKHSHVLVIPIHVACWCFKNSLTIFHAATTCLSASLLFLYWLCIYRVLAFEFFEMSLESRPYFAGVFRSCLGMAPQ